MNNTSESGFLLIDKPAGISSFDVIRQLRRQTGIRTFGHAGTLDPFATGLMVLAVNKYTRLLSLLDAADKTYIATMHLDHSSTTGDPEGEITELAETPIDAGKLPDLKNAVLQIILLKPPIHSAIKVDGKRAYKLARKDIEIDLPARPSRILEFEVLNYDYPALRYSCRVSKGTYIRSLSVWIAEFFGTRGYTVELRRTAIGSISIQKAVQVADLSAENLANHLLSVADLLPSLQSVVLTEPDLKLIRTGMKVNNSGNDTDQVIIIDSEGICRGIGYRLKNTLHPKINL